MRILFISMALTPCIWQVEALFAVIFLMHHQIHSLNVLAGYPLTAVVLLCFNTACRYSHTGSRESITWQRGFLMSQPRRHTHLTLSFPNRDKDVQDSSNFPPSRHWKLKDIVSNIVHSTGMWVFLEYVLPSRGIRSIFRVFGMTVLLS